MTSWILRQSQDQAALQNAAYSAIQTEPPQPHWHERRAVRPLDQGLLTPVPMCGAERG